LLTALQDLLRDGCAGGAATHQLKNCVRGAAAPMRDMEVHLEKLLTDSAECELISRLTTDLEKRELFRRLSEHLKVLAGEVEQAIER
jgi:hypothetical protein